MSSRNTAIVIGGLVGAALGAAAAWAYTKAQDDKLLPQLSTKYQVRWQAGVQDYVKIGVTILALVRQMADLLKPV